MMPLPSQSTSGRGEFLISGSFGMLSVRDGDETAFAFLIAKYRRPIVHFMNRMVHIQMIAGN
jgi:RNA polymerase sigma-70 factor (ECF subfamily)